MDDDFVLASKMDVDSMIDDVKTDMVPLDQAKMNVEELFVDEVRHLKESHMVFRDEKQKKKEIEEISNEEGIEGEKKNDEYPKEEMTIEENNEEDPEEELENDDPKEETNIEENNEENGSVEEYDEEDPEEEVKNDDPKEEMNIEENNEEEGSVEEYDEEDPEEEVKNDDPKEKVTIEENSEENPEEEMKTEEDTRNEAKNEGKLQAMSENKVSKLRKRQEILEKKTVTLRKKVKNALLIALGKKTKNALVSTPELDKDGWVGNGDTERVLSHPVKMHGKESIISLPMCDKRNFGTGRVTSEKSVIVANVDTGVATSEPVGKKTEHEIGSVTNEENTKDEGKNEQHIINEAKTKEELETYSKKKNNKLRKTRKRKNKALRGKNEVVIKNIENPESSKKKTSMNVKIKGMIFMCSSKTKKDCYHFQVLGFPASKRDAVFEIYQGMKLFLFDYDLKLMYGIYEAAGPGGYNIEPKAFNSAFPSQVRFKVLEDCLPLAEEKFKKIIKDNYYSKNKFHCELNLKQVKNLCKLFRVASKGSKFKQLCKSQQAKAPALVDGEPKHPHRNTRTEIPQAKAPTLVGRGSIWPSRKRKAKSLRAEAPTLVECGSKRPHRSRKAEGSHGEAPSFVDRKSKRSRKSRKDETQTFLDPKPKRLRQSLRVEGETETFLYRDGEHHGWEEERRRAFARDQLYSEDPGAYRRKIYESPREHLPLHPPLASALLPSSERDVYRRDQLVYNDQRPLDVELRRRVEFEHHDAYTISRYQDEFQRRGSYITSRGYSSYYYPSSSTSQPSEYYPLAPRRPVPKYHLSAGPQPYYQPHRPVNRY